MVVGGDGPGGVAAGGVHDAGDGASVEESVLLGQRGLVVEVEFEVAFADGEDFGSDGTHQALAGEAFAD